MDPFSAIATISQLIGSAIALWQEIDLSRQSVRDAPKVIREVKAQLFSLQNTVKQIENQPRLRIDGIKPHLSVIRSIMIDLEDVLEGMIEWQRRSPLRQGLHALHCRGRDDERLRGILTRMVIANQELSLRLHVATVSIIAELERGMRLERAERQGENLMIEPQSEANRSQHDTQEQLTKWESLKEALERDLVIEGNVAENASRQVNAIFGYNQTKSPTTARISENMALNSSSQSSIISSGTPPLKALRKLWNV